MAFDFGVEIHKMPGELRRQQTADSAFARTHKTGQADQAAFRDRPRRVHHRGLVRWRGFLQEIQGTLFMLQNFDCTTKGRELDLGVPFVHRAEKALALFRGGVRASVRVRLE